MHSYSSPLRRRSPSRRSLSTRPLLQPFLNRVVGHVARQVPGLFARLGPYRHSRFLIDVSELPFLLLLRPDPEAPKLIAWPRGSEPASDARIAGKFRNLLGLLDGGNDGDALFFSRDLIITGNLEAVVCLRNAIEDVEGAFIDSVTGSFGPPGRFAWTLVRRRLDATTSRGGLR